MIFSSYIPKVTFVYSDLEVEKLGQAVNAPLIQQIGYLLLALQANISQTAYLCLAQLTLAQQTVTQAELDEFEDRFGFEIDWSQTTPDYPASQNLALMRYEKGLQDTASWLLVQTDEDLDAERVFKDVFGPIKLTSLAAREGQAINSDIQRFYTLDTTFPGVFVFELARDGVENKEIFETYGYFLAYSAANDIAIAKPLSPFNHSDFCAKAPNQCSGTPPEPVIGGEYTNAPDAGNIAHELAHILVNSSGFGTWTTSPFNRNSASAPELIAKMNEILNEEKIDKYNLGTTVNETLANFFGALFIGDNDTVEPLAFQSRNDGFVLSGTQLSELNTAATNDTGKSYQRLVSDMLLINALRNTPSSEIATLLGEKSGDIEVTIPEAAELQLSFSPNVNSDLHPFSIPALDGQDKGIILATNSDSTWLLVGVSRPSQGNATDYGWILANEVVPIPNVDDLPGTVFDAEVADIFTIISSSNNGVEIGLR